MASAAAIELRSLARRFGRRWVLRGIDFSAVAGEVIGITGRNGSGKTTLLRVCATLLRPTRGRGSVFGADLVSERALILPHVGMLAHNAGVYDHLTAAENLLFSQRMAGLVPVRNAVAGALERVALGAHSDERVHGFSAGMRRRLALARLLLRPPRLLLLDEPYASFDTDGIAQVNAFARRVASGGGVVLVATHDLERARTVLDRNVHIEEGRISDDAVTAPRFEIWGAVEHGG